MSLRNWFSAGTALLIALGIGFSASATESDELTASDLTSSNGHTRNPTSIQKNQLNQGQGKKGIANIDSIPNFSASYQADGVDQSGNPQTTWFYNMVGHWPHKKDTTVINAPIVPVTLDLRNFDGSPRFVNGKPLVSDATRYVPAVLQSPVFQNSTYSSSDVPTQYTDAVQRAEFYNFAKAEWHTLLSPAVKAARTMKLIRGTYRFALNRDGTCCLYVLVDETAFGNAFFPATQTDTTTPIGAAENAGDITTQDISTFLFPNTFLYNQTPADCCVLGFHTYDVEPGDASNGNLERRYVLNYSSWITPGLFGASFQDVTALSHELSETFNDPFVASDGVHNVTPWWLSPNGLCQDNLEDGDVIEGLPNATYPITMPNGYTYHPQNEALLQYFEFLSPSDAINGAYSYPDTTVLSGPSRPQNAHCK